MQGNLPSITERRVLKKRGGGVAEDGEDALLFVFLIGLCLVTRKIHLEKGRSFPRRSFVGKGKE